MVREVSEVFGGVVFSYTRAQAIEDGVLVDVMETAKEAGFTCPVALTAALWADVQDIPEHLIGWEDVTGRLWDVLFMAHVAIKRSGSGSVLVYTLILHVEDGEKYRVKLVAGPGDEGELVITLMQPDED